MVEIGERRQRTDDLLPALNEPRLACRSSSSSSVTLAQGWKDLNYVGGKADTIRAAEAGDAVAIAAIYNEGIEERVATFETRPRSAAEVAGWLGEELPFLVAVSDDGAVMGFARVSPYSDRCVYAGVGEHGVYVARSARGRGLGRALLEALCAESESAGLHKLTSRIFSDNLASRAVHVAAGFAEVGVQRRHGQLDGAWKDCVLVERLLGPAAAQDGRTAAG